MHLPTPIQNYLNSHENIIDKIIQIDPYNDHPKFYHYAAILTHRASETSTTILEPNAISSNKTLAVIKACMEAIERYSVSNISNEHKFTEISWNMLVMQNKSAQLDEFIFPQLNIKLPKPYEIKRAKFKWLYISDLLSKKKYYVPARLVYFLNSNKHEPQIRVSDTTGLAASFSLENALIKSITEIIEREAFAIFYYTRARYNRVETKSLNNKLRTLIQYIESYNFQPVIIDMTNDTLIPSYSCWLINKSKEGPFVVMGAGADLNNENAIHKAVMESVQSLTSCRNMQIIDSMLTSKTKTVPRPYLNRASVKSLLYWAEKKHDTIKFLNFIKSLPEKTLIGQSNISSNNLNAVTDSLKRIGIKHIYWINTAPSLKKYGIFVTRVVIPELIPLSLKNPYSYKNSTRIVQATVNIGVNAIRNYNNYTTTPHPFP